MKNLENDTTELLKTLIDDPIKDKDDTCISIRIKDAFNDGKFLPDCSYDIFVKHIFYNTANKYGSASDMAYDNYLDIHGMKDITDFNTDGISDMLLVVENKRRNRKIIFKAVYDSDNSDEDEGILTSNLPNDKNCKLLHMSLIRDGVLLIGDGSGERLYVRDGEDWKEVSLPCDKKYRDTISLDVDDILNCNLPKGRS